MADEHLATEISLRVLALHREAQRVAQARGGHVVLLATPPDELHVVALRMIGNLLREAGYGVRMLGPDVPAAALAAATRRHEADALCLSATLPRAEDQLLIALHEVERQWPAAGFVVGGRGLTSRMRARPGIEVCRRVSEVVEAVDAVVKRASRN